MLHSYLHSLLHSTTECEQKCKCNNLVFIITVLSHLTSPSYFCHASLSSFSLTFLLSSLSDWFPSSSVRIPLAPHHSMGQPTNLYSDFQIIILLALCWGQRSNPDDERPSCGRCDLRLTCNCSYDGFTRVPMVTDRALSLDLSYNNITVVTDDDLTGHRQLRALSLHGGYGHKWHLPAHPKLWIESFWILKLLNRIIQQQSTFEVLFRMNIRTAPLPNVDKKGFELLRTKIKQDILSPGSQTNYKHLHQIWT